MTPPRIKMWAILPLDDPSPIGYMNVYEEGDMWMKIKGCEDCPAGQRKACCGKCPLVSEAGCFLHLDNQGQNKPFACIVQPRPDKHRPRCVLEWRCIKGKFSELIHKSSDPRNVFYKNGKQIMLDRALLK